MWAWGLAGGCRGRLRAMPYVLFSRGTAGWLKHSLAKRTSLWLVWSPWLKLKRATFMPASMSAPRPSSDQQAGPRVHTILVFRGVLMGDAMRSRLT
jgi:hypothetical protein